MDQKKRRLFMGGFDPKRPPDANETGDRTGGDVRLPRPARGMLLPIVPAAR